jgi:hypothetical protein
VFFSLKRKLVIAIALLALAAFAGGAYASTQETTDPQQAFLNDVAKRLNVTPAALKAAIKGAYEDQINAALASGKITQAQAKALKQRLAHSGGLAPLFGPSPLGPSPSRFFGRPGGLVIVPELSAAASYLGLTEAQLLSDLKSGQSLAKIAASRHKSVSGLESVITASIRSRLEQLVSKKRITQDQANRVLKGLTTKLNSLINGVPRLGFGAGRAFGPGGPHPNWKGSPPAGGPWMPPGNGPYAPGKNWPPPPGNGPHPPGAPGKPASGPSSSAGSAVASLFS